MRLFFSWQSDIPSNKNIIRKSLQRICEDLDIEYTEDTRGEAGGDHVVDVLLRKITNSDIFVGDITLVGKARNGDVLSNSNVMYELGFAESKLGRSRIIMTMNEEYGTYEDMVFDLGKRMITRFKTSSNKLPSDEQKELTRELKSKIESIIQTGKSSVTENLDKYEKTLLYFANRYGDGFIEQSMEYLGSGSELTIGRMLFSSNNKYVFYEDYDTKKATFYLRAIDKLVAKGYLMYVAPNTSAPLHLGGEKTWIISEEGEVVALAITEDEVTKMIHKE